MWPGTTSVYNATEGSEPPRIRREGGRERRKKGRRGRGKENSKATEFDLRNKQKGFCSGNEGGCELIRRRGKCVSFSSSSSSAFVSVGSLRLLSAFVVLVVSVVAGWRFYF